ncbi:hypothetical protein FRC10_009146 [Ceratobasidium sp. 414]|nr:hypothetical protein FRC10_009146 [Ceratobasidium sp. 414]
MRRPAKPDAFTHRSASTDSGIVPFRQHVKFSPSTYIGRGYLQNLIGIAIATETPPIEATPVIAFGEHLDTRLTGTEFVGQVQRLIPHWATWLAGQGDENGNNVIRSFRFVALRMTFLLESPDEEVGEASLDIDTSSCALLEEDAAEIYKTVNALALTDPASTSTFLSLVRRRVVMLGFPAKYRERLRQYEDAMDLSGKAWANPPTHSNATMLRHKQQKEWDRLNVAVSVITATSATALAIQAVSQSVEIYWLVTSFYSTPFGLSLQGLLLITYMTISAGGASDEAICRLAKGKLISKGHFKVVRPVAFTMALPAIFATYSSLSLLAGLVTMVISGPGEGVQHRSSEYIKATMIPVGTGFLCLGVACCICEVGTWVEMRGRAPHHKSHHAGQASAVASEESHTP